MYSIKKRIPISVRHLSVMLRNRGIIRNVLIRLGINWVSNI